MTDQFCDKLLTTLSGSIATELSISEQQVLLKSCAQYSHEFMILRDQNGQTRFISDSCLKLTGYSASSFIENCHLLERIIHPNDINNWRQKHETDNHETIQLRIINNSGQITWFEHNCSPLCDSDGTMLGHIGNFVDINETKKAQDAGQKLALAVEQNLMGVAITDINGMVEYVNPAFNLYQNTPFKVSSGELLPILDPTKTAGMEIRQHIAACNLWTEEVCLKRQKGGQQWYSQRITPIFDDDSDISHFLVVKVDINERLRVQQQIEEQHQQLQALFSQVETGKREWEWSLDCINDVVILADEQGKIRRINKAITTMMGLTIAEAIGSDWRDLLPDELSTLANLPLNDEFYDHKRGKWLHYQIFPFEGSTIDSQIVQVVTLHDNTAIWKINLELSEAYAHQKAAQSQMVHQEKMASIGQLAAGVAHEINNPTGFITSNLSSLGKYAAKLNQHITFLEEIIAKQQDTEISAAVQQHQKQLKLSFVQDDINDLIEESLEGAERIKTIVQNLKSFSRVDDTGMSHANLHQCLDSALSIGQNEIKYKATITKDYQDIPDCNCNAQQLNQVFLNLLVNAAQAMEQPGTITIQTLTKGSWIVIKISDDGTGIEPEFLSRIFEPFFTTKDVGKGTGLGLSICYDIIQKHHGEITVVSEVGQGTNFTIKLPISAEEHNEPSVS